MDKDEGSGEVPVCIPTNVPQFEKLAVSTMPVTKQHASNARSPCSFFIGPRRYAREKNAVGVAGDSGLSSTVSKRARPSSACVVAIPRPLLKDSSGSLILRFSKNDEGRRSQI